MTASSFPLARRAAVLLAAGALVTLGACANDHLDTLAARGEGVPATPDCSVSLIAPSAAGAAAGLIQEGCWNAANLAKMVVDPHDLVRGQPLGPANGARESLAIDAYQRGQIKIPADSASRPPMVVTGISTTGQQ